MIVAHRGASQDAPENTMPAFKLAWEQGADAIEGDFHLTKDGYIVCIHDDNTKRVSDANLVVNKSTLAELRELDVGGHHEQTFKGTRIPTIAEVFSTIPDQKQIFIEVKCGVEIIPVLLKEIEKAGLMLEQVVVISFNKMVIQKLKAQAPQFKTSWLRSFKRNKTGEITPSNEAVLNTLSQIQADALGSNAVIPESLVEAVLRQGYEWHVWTINDADEAKKMIALGATSITTDVPDSMKKHLVEQDKVSVRDKPRSAISAQIFGGSRSACARSRLRSRDESMRLMRTHVAM